MNLGGVKQYGRMKNVLRRRLTDSCNITTPTYAADSYGGRTVSSSTANDDVPCLVQPMDSGLERAYEGVLKSRQGYRVMLPALTTVSLKSTITTGSVTLEVVAVDQPLSNDPIKRVICAKIS
jgi:hypothetical protein